MIRRNLICSFVIAAALCFSVPAQENQTPVKPPTAATQATPATPATTAIPAAPATKDAGSDLVVLKVLGEPVSEKLVLSAMSALARQKQIPSDPKQPRNVTLFLGAVDNLITTAVLRDQVKQLNIAPNQARVDQQIQALSKQFPSPEEFQKALADQKTTEADLRKNLEESMRIQQVIDQATKDIPPTTDDEIQKFYDNNPKNFLVQEQVHAAHILLLVDKKATPEQKEEIRKKLEGIRADIEANKITFEDAAAKYSEDKTNASKGGELGNFPRGRMVKPFEDAAFGAQAGTITPAIESEFGFHIIKVIEKKPAGTVSLEEAKPKIKQYLDQSSRRKAAQQYVNDLKTKAGVENFMTPEEFLKRHPEVQ
jgi:peptidyl-prolyl cis-trans isomerase C